MLSEFKNPKGDWLEAAGMRVGFIGTPKRMKEPDDVAAYFGLRRLGNNWIVIDRDVARIVLQFLLREDQAYRRPRLATDIVERLSSDFLSWFPADTKFYTNGRVDFPPTMDKASSTLFYAGWTPATEATFDSGIIAFGKWSGVFWIEDED